MMQLTPHSPSLRRLPALAVLAAAFAVPATAHAASTVRAEVGDAAPAVHAEVGDAAPAVHAEVGDHAIALATSGHVARGPVRLRLSGEGLAAPRTVAVIELRRGVTRADVAAAELAGLADARAAERLGRPVAGGEVSARRDHVTTIVARARRHAVVDVSSDSGAAATFRVGDDASGARLPAAAATLGLRDDGLRLPATLPRRGVLRIANDGRLAHAATAFRVPRSMSAADAVRAVRRGGDLDWLGARTVLTGLVSARAVNRVRIDLRRGRYVIASLYSPLARGARPDVLRGLVGAVRVR